MIPHELLAALRNCRRALVISHVKPDGDAVGSLLAMGTLLRAQGTDVTLTLQDPVPAELSRLPGVERIVTHAGIGAGYDTVVVVDASSPDRMGTAWSEELRGLPLLVIDHHVTNNRFGTVNWVAADNAATCQMLVELADTLGVPLSGELAQNLLTGLVTDTLCFRTNNTTPQVLAAGMRLLQAGASLTDITEGILDQRPFSVIRLWGRVLDGAEMEQGVIWACVSRADFAASQAGNMDDDPGGADSDGSLSSMLIRTIGADMSASFLEKVDEAGDPAVECSFRARRGFDISRIALELGGGGHPAAGGVTIAGTLDQAVATVVPMLQAARRAQLAHQL